MYDIDILGSKLNTKELGRTFLQFDSVQCAVKKARNISAQSPNGMIILAEEQWNSKGRNKGVWYSPKGGLYLSIIFKSDIDRDLENVLNLGSVAAIYDALDKIGIETELKFPNDLYYDGKKLGSTLVEKSVKGKQLSYIVGIRINLDINHDDLVSNIDRGISINQITDKKIQREVLVSDILNNLEEKYLRYVENKRYDLFRPWIEMLEKCDNLMEIRKRGNKRWKKIEIAGFNNDGNLLYTDCLSSGNVIDMKKMEVRMIKERDNNEDR